MKLAVAFVFFALNASAQDVAKAGGHYAPEEYTPNQSLNKTSAAATRADTDIKIWAAKALLGILDERGVYTLKGDTRPIVTVAGSGKLVCPTSTNDFVDWIKLQIERRQQRLRAMKDLKKVGSVKGLGKDSSIPHGAIWPTPAADVAEMSQRWNLIAQYNLVRDIPIARVAADTKKTLKHEMAALKQLAQSSQEILDVCKEMILACHDTTDEIEHRLDVQDSAFAGGTGREIEMTSFHNASRELGDALNTAGSFDSVVLDLRGNNSGKLDEVNKSVALFTNFKKPVLILVDAQTAGPAEQFVRQLRAVNANVLVSGERTFGGGMATATVCTSDRRDVTLQSPHFSSLCGNKATDKAIEPDVTLSSRTDSDPEARVTAKMNLYAFAEYDPRAKDRAKLVDGVKKELAKLRTGDRALRDREKLAADSRAFFAKYKSVPLEETAYRSFLGNKQALEARWKIFEDAEASGESDIGRFVSTIARAQLQLSRAGKSNGAK